MHSIKLAFLGDIALNGDYETLHLQGKKPFSEVGLKLEDAVVVGNLESFTRGEQGVNKLKKPRLETSVETLDYLNDIGLDVACLANNHAFDHLEDGFLKTVTFLKQNSIGIVGASLENDDFKKPHIIKKDEIKIALLNYVTTDTNTNPPTGTQIHLNYLEEEKIKEAIKMLKGSVDHIVLSLHWGGRVEGGLFPDWDQPKIARRIIDAGADMIIGHHSHTIQPREVYKGKYIYYSLGNFCFSDFTFGEKHYHMPRRRRRTLIPIISFSKSGYTVKNTFWFNDNLFIKEQKKSPTSWIKSIGFVIYSSNYYVWKIYYFSLKKIAPVYFFLIRSDMSFTEKLKSFEYRKILKLLKK